VTGRSAGEIEGVAAEIGGIAVRADLADPASVDRLVAELRERCGRLDVLVNNAGENRNAPMPTMSLDDYDAVAGVTRGTWYLTKLVLRRFMLRQGAGRIVTIGSVVGHTGNAGQVPYTMAKAGLDAMTRSLAQEVAGRGILGRVPLGRMGTAAEVADVVAFLATRGSYVHGSVVHVNGGMYGG
jgi:3-oxoacyl-[acyl-carrier protein] reductase